MNIEVLAFEPISLFRPGALADIIGKSYAELVEKWPDSWKNESQKWTDFDRQAFASPDTVGRCVFVSCLDDQPVGLASYGPRQGPEVGLVGQNCVLPEFRGRGFGRLQILEILRRFGESGTKAARVITSGHPFFVPATRMYQSLGFKETRHLDGGPDPQYQVIELEMDLAGRSESDR
jgi:GNAT superfamily N-acetyltransferase